MINSVLIIHAHLFLMFLLLDVLLDVLDVVLEDGADEVVRFDLAVIVGVGDEGSGLEIKILFDEENISLCKNNPFQMVEELLEWTEKSFFYSRNSEISASKGFKSSSALSVFLNQKRRKKTTFLSQRTMKSV